jgi:hypothetical protein
MAVEVIDCPTRLQTPAPVYAKIIATIPETRNETLAIQNLVRKSRALSSNAFCTTLRELKNIFKAIVVVIKRSCGSLKKFAMRGAASTKRMVRRVPSATFTQNTELRCRSETLRL